MAEVDDFLESVLPRLRSAEVALHEGDPARRQAMWAHDDPVTLFGAEVERTGRSELDPTFEWIASRFTDCQSFDYEVVAAGASGDLAYLVAYEHITATVAGEPVSYSLRATTIFRRDAGEWRVVHRHGDPARR
jgi:ketosteroid isomerase-like protein